MATGRNRRAALQTFGIGLAAVLGVGETGASRAAGAAGPLLERGASRLRDLMERLAKTPRRRDFKAVPMILNAKDQWDDDAIAEVIAYNGGPKQVWDNTQLDSPWLNLMRNSLNAQIWSFRHPDFLVVSATHGSAHLALYDQTMWDKYKLTKLAGDSFKTNTLVEDKSAGDLADYENQSGPASAKANSIPTLMRRGVVFMACHNAIWEQAAKLLQSGNNPDKLSHEQLVAELTNHLIDGVVLTPGAVATIPELQAAGFHYIR